MIRPRRFWTIWCAALLACCIGIGTHLRAQVPMTGAGHGAPGAAAPTACSTLMGQVSGIQACLDADAGVALSGSNVTSWTDAASGYVFGTNAINGTSCASPTWSATSYGGKAGITLVAASGQCLATTAAAVTGGWTDQSWFIAANPTSSSQAFARLLNFTANGQGSDFDNTTSIVAILRDGGNPTFECFFNSAACTTYAITFGTAARFGFVISAGTASEYLNNVLQANTAKNPTLGATGQLGIGQGGAAYLDGVIRRVVITNTAVSVGDRTNIDSFLSN